MKIANTKLKDVKLIYLKSFSDSRGSFSEVFRQDQLEENTNSKINFVQENFSISNKHVLRGLHFQEKYPQGKYLQTLNHLIQDVVVDLRKQSSTFGFWESFYLDSNMAIWIPPGFAHGFLTFEDDTKVLYRCTDYYHPEDQKSINWDDEYLNIHWDNFAPIVSEKDSSGISFKKYCENDIQ